MRTQRAGSLTQGLVGAWCPSLGATGFRLQDRSGRNNHGTLTNMASTAWTTSGGKIALDFDGTNDSVNAGNKVPRLGNGHTFSAWVFKRANGRMIAGMCDFISQGGFQWADIGGLFSIAFYDGSIKGWFQGSSLPSNAWAFVCATFTNAQQRLTVNTTTTVLNNSTTGIVYNNDTFRIGEASGGNPLWQGQIDDVRIWNRVLTPGEVRQLYVGGRGFGLLPERPKRRGTAAAAAFKAFRARRQSQLIGGGL